MNKEQQRFIEEYLKDVVAGDAAIFAGAGLSAPAGFVDWRGLLRGLAEELGLNVELETDLVSLAQFHVNAQGNNRHRLNQTILEALAADNPPTANHRVLARLPIATWWTTNYDKLPERALREAGKVVDVKTDVQQLANTRPRRDAIIYKMHGDVDRPNEAVLTRDDYERYETTRGAFTNALAGDLISKTFLFLGFSFTDPNLDQVLSRVRIVFRENQRRHFAIFRRRPRQAGESEDSYAHAQARQLLVVQDLKRFNVQVLLVDEYGEIDEILQELEHRYRQRTVFISASAADFAPWGEQQVHDFMRALGAVLIDEGMQIVTGLGSGTGNALFTGAVERVLAQGMHIEDAILARPFPQASAGAAKPAAIWDKFRRDLIGRAGIALFLFGNKNDASGPVQADGVEREYEIAKELGVVTIPIGATGSMAEILAKTALAYPESHLTTVDAGGRKILADLEIHTDDLSELLKPLMRLIKHLRH